MYSITAECEFDSAHFLKGYPGGCANIHGHRWRVVCEVISEDLIPEGTQRGMVMDFKQLKKTLKALGDQLDHSLIYETGTLQVTTLEALNSEGFQLYEVPFRPTAEHLARFFHEQMEQEGFVLEKVTVFETPTNAASYKKGMGKTR